MADDFGHLQPGDTWKPTAFEVNAMKDAARKAQVGMGISGADGQLNGVNSSPVVVRVKNLVGGSVDRYTWHSVEDPRWAIDADMSIESVFFELVPHSNSKTQAVVQQPLAAGGFGTAVISGATIIKVDGSGSSTDRYGSSSSGVLSPTSSASNGVRLVHARPTGGGYALAVIDSPVPSIVDKPQIKLIITPPSGIAPATVVTEDSDGPLTIAYTYEDCYEYIHYSVSFGNIYNGVRQAVKIRVSNPTMTQIPGSIIIPCYNFSSLIGNTQNQWWACWPGADGTTSPWVEGAIDPP